MAGPATSTITKTKTQFKLPSMWKVILHNDDFTPFDFVIELLQVVFNKSETEAEEIALFVHTNGRAQVGLYTKEIAQTKALMAQELAEECQHPLLATAEEA